jgi:hypothetical protein
MSSRDEERERRLAAALRDNLKRRKAQARAETPEGDPPALADAPITPEPEKP